MMHSYPDPPLRLELRELFEISVQPLNLYCALQKRFMKLPQCELTEHFSSPTTVSFRKCLQEVLPKMRGPYLDLASRVALCTLLEQTTIEEEISLGLVLLEYLAIELEPYLGAAEVDPDQAAYLAPMLADRSLTVRPVGLLSEVRQTARKQIEAAEANARLSAGRAADGGKAAVGRG